MRNNILGGLVVFLVVVTCLILLDDISTNTQDKQELTSEIQQNYSQKSDLVALEAND